MLICILCIWVADILAKDFCVFSGCWKCVYNKNQQYASRQVCSLFKLIYIYIYTYIYLWLYTCNCYTLMCVFIDVCIYIYMCVCIYMYRYRFSYVYLNIYICRYIYIYINIHYWYIISWGCQAPTHFHHLHLPWTCPLWQGKTWRSEKTTWGEAAG
jgi:hypothetical protein